MLKKLYLSHIQVNKAPITRRRTFRAHGRIGPYEGNPSHIELILSEEKKVTSKPENKTTATKAAPAKKAASTGSKPSTTSKASSSTTDKVAKQQQIIAVGLNKGHFRVKRNIARPSRTKGRNSKHNIFIREVVREVSGFSPYEKRLLELLRNGLEKRALKLAKRKLGTRTRAKKKFNEMTDSLRKIREQRMKEQEAHKA